LDRLDDGSIVNTETIQESKLTTAATLASEDIACDYYVSSFCSVVSILE